MTRTWNSSLAGRRQTTMSQTTIQPQENYHLMTGKVTFHLHSVLMIMTRMMMIMGMEIHRLLPWKTCLLSRGSKRTRDMFGRYHSLFTPPKVFKWVVVWRDSWLWYHAGGQHHLYYDDEDERNYIMDRIRDALSIHAISGEFPDHQKAVLVIGSFIKSKHTPFVESEHLELPESPLYLELACPHCEMLITQKNPITRRCKLQTFMSKFIGHLMRNHNFSFSNSCTCTNSSGVRYSRLPISIFAGHLSTYQHMYDLLIQHSITSSISLRTNNEVLETSILPSQSFSKITERAHDEEKQHRNYDASTDSRIKRFTTEVLAHIDGDTQNMVLMGLDAFGCSVDNLKSCF
ncbi:unnamed protein product [Periconia digitata]|uniref:Uncharacterized protein n=1 Tax=Periconia digitata TaxID=1303443 RepID=A0A9W4UN72_9PLEO|nr:unnamed protein product [Periconia digitata]